MIVLPATQYYYGKIANCCLERRYYPSQAFVDATKENILDTTHVNNTCQLDASCWTRYEKNKEKGQEAGSDLIKPIADIGPIKAVADTFIRGGSHSANNYGSDTILPVKNASGDYTRISLLQFNSNLSSLSHGRKAKLRLFVSFVDRDISRTVSVARLPKTFALDEDTATWQNTPLDQEVHFGSSTLTIAFDQQDQWVEIDITDLLIDGEMVLALENNGPRTSDNLVAFASKETLNGPRIIFEDYTAPPTPSPSGLCLKVWEEVMYTDEEIQTKLDFITGGCDYKDETFESMLAEAHAQCLVEVIAESMAVTIIDRPTATYVKLALS